MTSVPARVECKYCVPVAEADSVLRMARVFLDIDRAAWPDASYDGPLPVQRITSLYLDSPARTFFAWHVARRPSRFKLRLRRYSAGRSDAIWAEVKHKVHGRVLKTRALLPPGALSCVEAGRPVDESCRQQGDQALDDFLARQRAFGARAQVLLQCQRRALRGTGQERAVGVTVDTDLCLQRGPQPSLREGPGGDWLPLSLPHPGPALAAIVELKHGGHPPVWMRRVMTRLGPWQCSYSKYVAATRVVTFVEGGR